MESLLLGRSGLLPNGTGFLLPDLCTLLLSVISMLLREGLGIGGFHRVVSDVHHRLCDLIHGVIDHRRCEAIRGGGIGFERTLRPDLVPTNTWWFWGAC